MAYARRQLQRRLSYWACAALLVIAAIIAAAGHDVIASGVAVVAVIGMLVFQWRIWRCPVCEKPFGNETGAHCMHCGTKLVP